MSIVWWHPEEKSTRRLNPAIVHNIHRLYRPNASGETGPMSLVEPDRIAKFSGKDAVALS
ncbi:hypothetical protein PIIN_11539 [Serendipita indica DSM 11827]|uniref:Uncharacterized protein n=1 Tax=Serendipita indica (strain DSM 11827) TaxID=1109443 RepID=G4U1W9_SERID|nr:hypothetical protein PIIN_11539 [Serendipita indica DSM 11827]